MALSPIEQDLRNQVDELRARIETLNSNYEDVMQQLTDLTRVIDLLVMLGHLDDKALKAAMELIKTGLKL